MLKRPEASLVLICALALACSANGGNKPGGAGGAAGDDETGGNGGNGGTGGRAGSGGSGGRAGSGGSGGGMAGSGGSTGGSGGGMGGSGGSTGGTGGAVVSPDGGASPDTAAPGPDVGGAAEAGPNLPNFSFFLTSYKAMMRLSGTPKGFGGDLRFGEATGLAGADKICTQVAETSMPGSGAKGWKAFLSARTADGMEVHAIDRIGTGPWYDRTGRLVAMNKAALLNERPMGAHMSILEDLPNEDGIPNHRPDPSGPQIDNHHVLTGSNGMGRLYGPNATCNGWTALTNAGRPRIGFSWTIANRRHWISGQDEGGCGAGVDLDGGGGSDPSNPVVGSGGGYGAIYCFANRP